MKNVKIDTDSVIDKNLYNRLIDIAKKKSIIHYQKLASQLVEPYDDINERNEFHQKLGNISVFEHDNKRPMLSVLVVIKKEQFSDKMEMPGTGFFELARKLDVWNGEDRERFFIEELKKVYGYWGKK